MQLSPSGNGRRGTNISKDEENRTENETGVRKARSMAVRYRCRQ